jgi:hypothetical protein
MYPLFQDLIEQQRQNLLNLFFFKHKKLNSMKCTIMRNMSWKQCFSKLKMEIDVENYREIHSEFRELKDWTDINRQTTWVGEWGLLHSMKLKHKMKLWTKWNFLLIKMRSDGELSCDICAEINDLNLLPDIQHITKFVSSISYKFVWNSSYLSIKAKWVLLPLKFDARKGSIL